MLDILKVPFLALHYFYYTLMTFLMMLSVILLCDDTTLHSKCDQASNLMQQLELASNLNLIYETLKWGSQWLFDINAEKTQLVSFHLSYNIGAVDVKMYGFFREENLSFKILIQTFFSKLDRGSYSISIARTACKKMIALVCVHLRQLMFLCCCYSTQLLDQYSRRFTSFWKIPFD